MPSNRAASILTAALMAAGLGCLAPGFAQEPENAQSNLPRLFDESERVAQIDTTGIQRLRFLTVTDNPPFAFLDRYGKLTGLDVDLVRALCEEMQITARCQIQGLPFDELAAALQSGDGDAVIAGMAATAEAREELNFTRPYLLAAARFVTTNDSALRGTAENAVSGLKIGVLAGSAHETLLRRDFADAQAVAFTRDDWMLEDLKAGRIDAILGDAARYAVWLNGAGADGCCRFASGPFLAPELLGPGWSIAVSDEDALLAEALNAALRAVTLDGTFDRILLRYFPLGIY